MILCGALHIQWWYGMRAHFIFLLMMGTRFISTVVRLCARATAALYTFCHLDRSVGGDNVRACPSSSLSKGLLAGTLVFLPLGTVLQLNYWLPISKMVLVLFIWVLNQTNPVVPFRHLPLPLSKSFVFHP